METEDPRLSQARALDEESKYELQKAAEALTSGQLFARSRHEARAEALSRARDRVLRKLRDGKGG